MTGVAALLVAVIAAPSASGAAASQTWPPFVLVAGLLTLGVIAHRDGLFDALGGAIGRLPAPPWLLLVLLLLVVAAVTAVLNLDTSVAFLTPVLILAARRRGLDEEAFLYGALLMSNAASLLLPGSNLTNLLVLAGEHVSGAVFAARMLPAWSAAVAITVGFVLVVHRRRLGVAPEGTAGPRVAVSSMGSIFAVVLAAALVLADASPALPVLALGVVVAAVAIGRRRIVAATVWRGVDPFSLAGVYGVAVALGTLARTWSAPGHLMASAGRIETAAVGAAAAVAVNNLPAAVLLASRHPAHPRALLLGLDLGPNLAVTGSLSALIWYRAATTVSARPSVRRVSELGVVLVPLSIAVTLLLTS